LSIISIRLLKKNQRQISKLLIKINVMKKLIILFLFLSAAHYQNAVAAIPYYAATEHTILVDTMKQEPLKVEKKVDRKRNRMLVLSQICLISGGVLAGFGYLEGSGGSSSPNSSPIIGLILVLGLFLLFLGVIVWLLQALGTFF
jgi:hypothetical protein